MSQYPIYFRKHNGICNKTYISSEMGISKVKNHISFLLNLETNLFRLYIRGSCVQEDYHQNKDILHPNVILDVVLSETSEEFKENDSQCIKIKFIMDGREQNSIVKPLMTVSDIKVEASKLFGVPCLGSDFIFENGFGFSEDKMMWMVLRQIEETNHKKYNQISIEIKPKIQSLFQNFSTPSKMRVVESVASEENPASDLNQIENDVSPLPIKAYKKQSHCTSMKEIKEEFFDVPGKRSAIITNNATNTPDNQYKLNGLKKMTVSDIRQTISFGSMEEQIPDSVQVQLTNQQETHFYCLACSHALTFLQIKQKLSQLEGKNIQQIQFEEGLEDSINLIDAHERDDFELIHDGKNLVLKLVYRC